MHHIMSLEIKWPFDLIYIFFHKTLFHIIYIFWQCILAVSMSTSCCWYIIFTLSGQNTVTSVISSYKYMYCKYRKTIWTDLSNSNSSRPVLQIPQCIRQTSLNAPLRTEMCPPPLWTVHRGTLPRHHWGHRWLSIRITPSARRRLTHRLKATSRGRKWAQIISFSRKMSPSAFSWRYQAPPGGEKTRKWQDTVSHVKAGRGPRPGLTPGDSDVNTDAISWLMTSWYHHVAVLLINDWAAPQRNDSRLSYMIYASISWSLTPWRRTAPGNQRPPCEMSHITWHRYQSRRFRL